MPKAKPVPLEYVGPHDAVDTPFGSVAHGKSLSFPPDVAAVLTEQPDNWQPVAAPSTPKES